MIMGNRVSKRPIIMLPRDNNITMLTIHCSVSFQACMTHHRAFRDAMDL